MRGQGVVEKFYSAKELGFLVGFGPKWWRTRMKAEPKLEVDGALVSQCVEISGEYLAPASWVNYLLARHGVNYDAGVRARNTAELRRKLAGRPAGDPTAAAV